MKLLGKYHNGNFKVSIYDDGTKIRENDLDYFQPEFPESIDLKISDRCNMMCEMCHEQSTPNGDIADLMSLEFIDTLHPYTELALGGGNVFECPDLFPFLNKLKRKNIIANITINQRHFEEYFFLLLSMRDEKLIHGLGVSLVSATPSFIEKIRTYGKNAVIHVINGVVTEEDIAHLKDNHLKILFLGFKDFGRGIKYHFVNTVEIHRNQQYVYDNLDKIFKWFKVISFDNLAIAQLNPSRLLSKQKYDAFYMGDDGQFTMYIDAVKGEYAKNSTSTNRLPLLNNIDNMFKQIKN